MALLLVCGFFAIPVIEIALMIEIGGWIGVAPTVAAIILTAGIRVVSLARRPRAA